MGNKPTTAANANAVRPPAPPHPNKTRAPKSTRSTESSSSTSQTTDNKADLLNQPARIGDYSNFSNKISIADFDLLKILGRGSFGKVMLVKKRDDPEGKLYAMKTLRKAELVKRNQVAHTSTERFILQHISSPFLVCLFYAFQSTDKLYMVLDYIPGGELFFWLKKEKRFSESRCRLYTAEIILAIEALHSNNIVYRDLKPENIMLCAKGHIKLTDFGLAKSNIFSSGPEEGTKTFCGTPEYLAPEIIENKGHGKAVDWWALGTLLYEMLTGLPPFYDSNVQKMYHKILHEPLRFPRGNQDGSNSNSSNRNNIVLSEEVKLLLTGLLERKINYRLGSGPLQANELKRSRFLVPLDFARVFNLSYTPEFIPPAPNSDIDVKNFDEEFTNEPAADSMVTDIMSQTMKDMAKFDQFTFQSEGKLE